MSANTIIGNRNSTPEASNTNLRPPASRNTVGTSHVLRSSTDMGFSSSPLSARSIRPSSEVIYNQGQQARNQGNSDDGMDKAAQQWIADIDQYETTLEEMAAATLDQDFKDELSAIEQWFKVLSEAERTAALYALLQQTTQVQIRFFIQVLQQMAKSHPMSGVLSPTSFGEKDAMTNRLSDAMNKLHVEGSRNSIGRPPPSPGPGAKRNSGMDPNIINAMFPDAAAAIAKQKADYTQQTGVPPSSNRNSTVGGERNSLVAPTISAPVDTSKDTSSQSANPWAQRQPELRPKSSSGQQPMGQFSQAPPSAGLRSPRPFQLSGSSNTQNTTLLAADNNVSDMPILSPYALGNASWASMSNTPMVPNFNTQQQHTQADMVANATAMKLAALSTVNNRIALDDVKKYRRTKSNDNNMGQMPMSPGIQGTNVLVVNESGQLLNSQPLSVQQLATIQAQQQAAMAMRGARPDSPGLAMQGAGGMGGMSFTSPQNNGFLAAHDGSFGAGGGPLNLNQFGMGHGGSHEGYLSDHSEIARGRSPRGRRGSSKPPEDPTDIALLQDIPNWLRSLRLHKYTDNLKDLKWTDLIDLDDKGLEDRGVNALGARRKMLKVFETVKEAQAEGRA